MTRFTTEQMLYAYDAVGRGGWTEPESLRLETAAVTLLQEGATEDDIAAVADEIQCAVDGSINHQAQRAVEQ